MVSAGDFRNGLTIEFEGNVYQVIEFQHVKPGKGAAFVRTKLKNIKSGGVVEKTFRPTEKCPQAHIERADMQYLYSDDMYHFMNVETYDQIDMTADQVGDSLKFVKENEMVIMPPSIVMFSPLIKEFRSSQRKRTARAMSAGSPTLCEGCCMMSPSVYAGT